MSKAKMWAMAGAVLLPLLANADDKMMQNKDNTMMQPEMVVLTSAEPKIDGGWDFSAMGQVFWWTSTLPGNEYVREVTPGFQSITRRVPYKWNVGFRVGLAFDEPRDEWDIGFYWTCFHNKGHDSINAPAGSTLASVDPDFSLHGATSAHAHTKLKLNLLDLEWGRNFYVGKMLTFRPLLGVRGQWIFQKERAEYSLATGADVASLIISNKSAGVGPRVGFNTEWKLGWGFGLTGNFATSMVYGYDKVSGSYYTGDETTFVTGARNASGQKALVVPEGDLGLGLMWDHTFSDVCYLAFEVVWEQHFFLGQWQWRSAATAFSSGNYLAMQGITLGAKLGF